MAFTWDLNFRVNDGGVQSAARNLSTFHERLGKTRDALFQLETASGRTTINLTKLSDAAGAAAMDGLKYGILGVTAALGAGAVALWKFGDYAQQAFGERQGTLRAYTTLLGSATEAQKEFSKAQRLSQMTDLTSEATEKAQKSLMVAGFRGRGLDQALLATADVAAMASPEERNMTAERVSRGLSQIFAKGKLQGEEINQLTEAGLSKKLITEALMGAGYGKSADATEKMISGGKISSDVGIAAIQQAILKQFNTKALGEYATGASGSISGLQSNRDEGIKNLLKSFDSEALAGQLAYKDALSASAESLSLNSESGQNLKVVFEDLASETAGWRAAWTDFTTGFVESAGAAWLAAMGEMGFTTKDSGEKIATLRDMAREAGESLGAIAGPIRKLINVIEEGVIALGQGWRDAKWAATHPFQALMGGDKDTQWDSALGRHTARGQVSPASSSADGGIHSYTESDGKLIRSSSPFAGVKAEAKWASSATAALRAAAAGGAGGGAGGSGSGGGGGDVTKIGTQVNLGGIRIEVAAASGATPGQIADEVETRFIAMVGRYAAVPA